MTTMTVSFPGGKRVDAAFDGFSVRTDQPLAAGGEGAAPSPFDLFLASVATCAGFYVKSYCDARQLTTAGLALALQVERDPSTKRVSRLVVEIALPEGFPEKHRDGVARAADTCAVRKLMLAPPAFEIRTLAAVGLPA